MSDQYIYKVIVKEPKDRYPYIRYFETKADALDCMDSHPNSELCVYKRVQHILSHIIDIFHD